MLYIRVLIHIWSLPVTPDTTNRHIHTKNLSQIAFRTLLRLASYPLIINAMYFSQSISDTAYVIYGSDAPLQTNPYSYIYAYGASCLIGFFSSVIFAANNPLFVVTTLKLIVFYPLDICNRVFSSKVATGVPSNVSSVQLVNDPSNFHLRNLVNTTDIELNYDALYGGPIVPIQLLDQSEQHTSDLIYPNGTIGRSSFISIISS
jgi:hypothetical protein